MLILTRRAQESIIIGDDITVTVLSNPPGSLYKSGIRLGIIAPKHIRVDRAEIRERINNGIPIQEKTEEEIEDESNTEV